MSNATRTGTLFLFVAAVLLFLFASGFLLNVLRSDFGAFITIMSVVVFAATILAVVVSFNLYRRMRSVS